MIFHYTAIIKEKGAKEESSHSSHVTGDTRATASGNVNKQLVLLYPECEIKEISLEPLPAQLQPHT